MTTQTSGSGSRDIVLAPGGPSLPASFYSELIEGLERFGTVHTVAFSGTHPQPQTPFPETIEEAADELADAISTLPHDRTTVLVGHSYGAAVAIELLCRERDHAVDGAVLISGFPSGEFLARSIAARMRALPRAFHDAWAKAQGDEAATAALTSEFWYPAHFCNVPWPESFVDAVSKLNPLFMGHVLGPSVFEPTGSARRWSREGCLPLRGTQLLVAGGVDDYFSPEAVRAVFSASRSDAGDVEFLFSDAASHSIWIEDPESFWTGLEAYFARIE